MLLACCRSASLKAFGSAPLERMSRSAFCNNTAQGFSPALDGPVWNGWSAGMTNTRFQPANAAKLTLEDVPRLKLKWAFGYPGPPRVERPSKLFEKALVSLRVTTEVEHGHPARS